ncbi:MAG: hypothetical protein LC723_13735 [Actinobacteria bacterium]|nr:hypothetical protein [Actinomycetota bacterium]
MDEFMVAGGLFLSLGLIVGLVSLWMRRTRRAGRTPDTSITPAYTVDRAIAMVTAASLGLLLLGVLLIIGDRNG